jgi:flagellar motor protein MotB
VNPFGSSTTSRNNQSTFDDNDTSQGSSFSDNSSFRKSNNNNNNNKQDMMKQSWRKDSQFDQSSDQSQQTQPQSQSSSKSQKLCHFFNSPNGCKKGDACPFLHQASDQSSSSSSSSSQQSTLQGGDESYDGLLFFDLRDCGFYLSAALSFFFPLDSSTQQQKQPRKQGICKYFQSGKCFRGDACKYSHELSGDDQQDGQQQQQQQSWQQFNPSFGQQPSTEQDNYDMEVMDDGQDGQEQVVEESHEVNQGQQLLAQKQEQIRQLKEKQKQLEAKVSLKKTIHQEPATEEEQTVVFDEDAEYVEDGGEGGFDETGEEAYYDEEGQYAEEGEEELPLDEPSSSSVSTSGSTTLRIANPPSNISLEQLTDHFSAFGTLKELKTKGDAIFVTFDSAQGSVPFRPLSFTP